MKCPNCSKSLWFIKDVCPFCKTAIAPQTKSIAVSTAPGSDLNPDGIRPAEDNLVTLVKCETLAEADAIRTQLEAAGIPAVVPDEALMQTIAWNMNTYGFVRVQVTSKDYESAQNLLSCVSDTDATDDEGIKLAELALSWPMRCLAFALPLFTCVGVFAFAVAKGGYSRQGCERKATELWHWFAGGIVFWLAALFVFIYVRALRV